MTKFTTNWAFYEPYKPNDPFKPKKKKTNFIPETDKLSEEIQHKIKLINKAFK